VRPRPSAAHHQHPAPPDVPCVAACQAPRMRRCPARASVTAVDAALVQYWNASEAGCVRPQLTHARRRWARRARAPPPACTTPAPPPVAGRAPFTRQTREPTMDNRPTRAGAR